MQILFSQFDRGRYATDASHYQIFQSGWLFLQHEMTHALIDIAREFDICLTVAVVEPAKTDKPSTSR